MNFKKIIPTSLEFPNSLKVIPDPPSYLYVAGDINEQDTISLAVVGSRKMSFYGKDVCYDIVSKVATLKVTIVSGLMYGIDITAHRVALENGTRTIGVLGFGSDYIGNVPDLDLAKSIVKNNKGAIITEYDSSQPPAIWTFPRRDRLIAGLATAVLVIEAGEKSGTFYTVDSCLKQGKDVLAVPGSIYSSTSRGCHGLIEDGARIVKSAEDVIDALGLLEFNNSKVLTNNVPLSESETIVLKLLNSNNLHINDIIAESNLMASEVSSILVELEMKGFIKDLGYGNYRKI